jgi:hypothetical protein
MRIRETIKKILSEEIDYEEKYEMVSDFMKTFYPFFNKEVIDVKKRYFKNMSNRFYIHYFLFSGEQIAKYHENTRALQLSRDIFETLEKYLQEDMTFVLDWFNAEFGLDAEHVTF